MGEQQSDNNTQQQTEQDFEHIGDSETIESRAGINSQDSRPDKVGVDAQPASDSAPESTDSVQAPVRSGINFNKYFLYTLVAGLVISALISITAVLIGEFNSTMGRALGTTVSMVAHTLFALVLVSISTKRGKSGGLVLNTLIFITIASFITSLFGIWEVISGRIVGDLYLVYFYSFSSVLWVRLLQEVGDNLLDKATRVTSQIGMVFTALFYALLVPTAFINYPDRVAEFHLRALAASVIALATVSVLTTVFHRIHIFKHPEAKSLPSTKNGWDIVMAILVLFIGLPVIFSLIAATAVYNDTNTTTYSTPTRTPYFQADPSQSPETKGSAVAEGDCSTSTAFGKTSALRYSATYTFQAYDAAAKSLTLTEISPVYFDTAPQFFDAHCHSIASSQVRPGDKITLYLHTGYQDFFYGALIGVQKLN